MSRKTLGFIFLLAILISVPVSVYTVITQRMEIRKEAREEKLPTQKEVSKPEYVRGEIIVKLKTELVVKHEAGVQGSDLEKESFSLEKIDVSSPQVHSLVNFLKQQNIEKIEKVFKDFKDPSVELSKFKTRFPQRKIDEEEALKIDLSRTYKLAFAEDLPVEDKIQQLQQNPLIEYAEPNYIFKIAALSNDHFLLDTPGNRSNQQKSSWDPVFDYQWNLKQIKVPEAWDLQKGSSEIVVAVIDTGCDFTNAEDPNLHPDFKGVQIIKGYDFINNDFDPYDDHGHGTAVSSIIGAKINNEVGMAGVLWEVKLLVIKALDAEGSGDLLVVANAIKYAADNGANVINMSFGAYTGGYDRSIPLALDYAHARNVVMVASAGNDNRDMFNVMPAAYPKVIAVSANDRDNKRASYSNFGEDVDVVAPGGKFDSNYYGTILGIRSKRYGGDMCNLPPVRDASADNSASYIRALGTSFSTPHVSGIAALILSQDRSLINFPDKARNVLVNTADDLGSPGFDIDFGYGRVNAFRAVSEIHKTKEPPLAYIFSPKREQLIAPNGEFIIRGTVRAGELSNYQLDYAMLSQPNIWHETGISDNSSIENDILGTWEVPALANGDYLLKLTVNTEENSSFTTVPFKIDNDLRPNWPVIIPLKRGESHPCTQPVVGDVDGDNTKEIVIHCDYVPTGPNVGSGQLYIFRPDGSLFPGWPKIFYLAHYNSIPTVPTLADINPFSPGLEIIIPGRAPAGHSWKTGVFAYSANYGLLSGWPVDIGAFNGGGYGVSTDDINNNGRPEIIFLDSEAWGSDKEHRLYAWDSAGRALSGFPVSIPKEHEFTYSTASPRIADLDGDGFKEIVVSIATYDNKNYLYVYNHSGQLISGWPKMFERPIGDNFVLGDINGDRKSEIILSQDTLLWDDPNNPESMNMIYVLQSNGTDLQGWPKRAIYSYRDYTYDLLLADIDQDSRPEILAQSLGGFWVVLDENGNVLPGFPTDVQGSTFPYQADSSVVKMRQKIGIASFGTIGRSSVEKIKMGISFHEYQSANVSQYPGFPKILGPFGWVQRTTPLLVNLDGDDKAELVATYNVSSERLEMYVFNLKENIRSREWPQYLRGEGHTGAWIPSVSPGDLDGDGDVDIQDLKILLSNWGKRPGNPASDLNMDGIVNVFDFGAMLNMIIRE